MSKRRRFAAARIACQSYESRSVFARNLFNNFFEQPDFTRARYSARGRTIAKAGVTIGMTHLKVALLTMRFIIAKAMPNRSNVVLREECLCARICLTRACKNSRM